MSAHVCPWWLAYTFDNPLRRLFHKPERMLGPYVREGMTVLDVGCGMGYFSIAMAKMVGPGGRVIAVDLQQKMLDILRRRAQRAGVSERIEARLSRPESIGVDEEVDFVLAFWVVHELPDAGKFFREARAVLKPGARLLMAEPKIHVTSGEFEKSISTAGAGGLAVVESPRILFSRAALLVVRDL
jgi:ubiquinone/menaquinone biosynthesis C-methylase UbiE